MTSPLRSMVSALVLVVAHLSNACAQSGGASKLTLQGPAEQSATPVVRDALNRPCLDVEAAARAHTVNKNLFDHVISVRNRCARLIKVKVCYFNSDNCRTSNIGGYQREDVILGTMTVNTFRYSISQK